jgi:hypothetical protein
VPSVSPLRLLKLADREFQQLTGTPPVRPRGRTFKPLRLNAARFDQVWDRKRGAAIRLTSVLLSEDDQALERRVCESDQATKTYAGAADWLRRESAYLRRIARLLDTASERVATVLGRFQPSAPGP